ncbi:MAG: hypothetical protein BGO51_09830 [Rhodospirillales bacterium 69-11]|nr:HD domain-containing protein [Rhodospirillales bacterium]OJW20097.1 MAG: hypothetical protein BGO51_09830 [Rhodospirillales bacterium 69-11]
MSAAFVQAAALHDIGKLTLPEQLWSKAGPLEADERCLARRHPVRGHAILRAMRPAVAEAVAEAALTHHEAWDGSGYPGGLRGREIPLVGRIVGLCDVYAALREARAYKAPFSHDQALSLIAATDSAQRAHSGMFDPDLLPVFLRAGQEVRAAFESAHLQDDGALRRVLDAVTGRVASGAPGRSDPPV